MPNYSVFNLGVPARNSGKSKDGEDEDEETAGTILSSGLRDFRRELYQWEKEEKSSPTVSYKPKPDKRTVRRRPKITRRRRKRTKDDVPRLYPD